MRKPDFVIGPVEDPYLLRWWIIPRNRWFNVYLHHVLRSDDDRALHDHPWFNVSIILAGGYWEVLGPKRWRWRRPGRIVLRRPTMPHRLALAHDTDDRPLPCWSLFITGPRVREWGFLCPRGWIPWQQFVDTREGGNERGAGCEEAPSGN